MLAEYGLADLGELLVEEHHVLRNVMNDIGASARAARAGGFSPDTWGAFRRLCGELIERLTSHIEKEERALIPELEDALTPETDTELAALHDLEFVRPAAPVRSLDGNAGLRGLRSCRLRAGQAVSGHSEWTGGSGSSSQPGSSGANCSSH